MNFTFNEFGFGRVAVSDSDARHTLRPDLEACHSGQGSWTADKLYPAFLKLALVRTRPLWRRAQLAQHRGWPSSRAKFRPLGILTGVPSQSTGPRRTTRPALCKSPPCPPAQDAGLSAAGVQKLFAGNVRRGPYSHPSSPHSLSYGESPQGQNMAVQNDSMALA